MYAHSVCLHVLITQICNYNDTTGMQLNRNANMKSRSFRLAMLAGGIPALLATTATAYAAPPLPGSRDAAIMAPFIDWVEHQYTKDDRWCCSISDGRPLNEDELRIVDGHYEVLFTKRHWQEGDEQWHPVAKESILPQLSPIGMPVAWLSSTGTVYCLALSGSS